MIKVYKEDVINFEEFELDDSSSVFEQILERRKREIDADRFYLNFISPLDLKKYDFNNLESLKKFRNDCLTSSCFMVTMGGCNLRKENVEKGIRYSGIKLSDPCETIRGVFDRHAHTLTYSPIFQRFYEERDLCKFAKETYFTPTSFEKLIMLEIEKANEFYLHTGRYDTVKDILNNGKYRMEKIDKKEMIKLATDPEFGEDTYRKSLRF